jgi:hypothetical protein
MEPAAPGSARRWRGAGVVAVAVVREWSAARAENLFDALGGMQDLREPTLLSGRRHGAGDQESGMGVASAVTEYVVLPGRPKIRALQDASHPIAA